MEIIRDPNVYSGFRVEQPVEGFDALTHCGEAACSASHRVPPHRHQVFEFMYVSEGDSTLDVAGETFTVHTGEMIVAYPEETHALNLRPHGKCRHLWLGVDLAAVSPRGASLQHHLQASPCHVVTDAHEAEPVLRGIMRQVLGRETAYAAVVQAQLDTLMAILLQCLGRPADNRARHAPCGYEVSKVVLHMRRNLHSPLPLGTLARIAGCSISRLCELFRGEIGVSPHAYHLQLRLDAAREALLQPDTSVTEIAQLYGFSSAQHFSTAFTRAFGMSPRQWRSPPA